MRISRLYLPDFPKQRGQLCTLPANSAHYLCNVLRLKTGAELSVFDGRGQEYSALVEQAGKRDAVIRIGEPLQPVAESPLHTHLGLGLTRGERMDYAIQKATELGVSVITPVFTDRCEVKLKGDRADKRTLHWQQVAISACEQCGRAVVPAVNAPVMLSEFLSLSTSAIKLILDHRQSTGLPDLNAHSELTLLTGPEGGFTEDEITLAVNKGFRAIRLGQRVLRAETAPLTALSVLQWQWGDLNR